MSLRRLRSLERRYAFIPERAWRSLDFGSERRAQMATALANAKVNFRIARRRLDTIRRARKDGRVAEAAARDLAFHHGQARRHLRMARALSELDRRRP